MRVAAAVSLVVGVLLVWPAAAQKNSTTPPPPPLEFTGCVSEQPGSNGTYTLTDAQNNGSKYRLTGKKMDKYAGKLVSVVSGPTKRLSVSGGLWPSPNNAGQAGALDPAQESISRQRGGTGQGAGDLNLPELHVVRVKTVGAACR
jgi:hypothetical protein